VVDEHPKDVVRVALVVLLDAMDCLKEQEAIVRGGAREMG
jgi:hypothetical protein